MNYINNTLFKKEFFKILSQEHKSEIKYFLSVQNKWTNATVFICPDCFTCFLSVNYHKESNHSKPIKITNTDKKLLK